MINAELLQQTEARFAARQSIRAERESRIREGAILEADDADRVRKRVQHIARMVIETEGVGPSVPGQPPAQAVAALERIMGKNDLMSVRYLELALSVARTVGRIQVRGPDGSHRGYGTGFRVSPRLILTNNHVLGDAGTAGASRIEFDFQEGVDGKLRTSIVAELDPSAFFTTDKTLDFSLVALKAEPREIAAYGWNGLSSAEGTVIAGEYVTIIQHPSGERKQLALRDNQVIDVLDDFLHYRTDTSPGSSGSPVFNDQWEIVALHHSGIPKKDSAGRILTRDGKVWVSSMGDQQIDWIANEGVRISRILKHLEGLSLAAGQAALRKELLESAKGWQPGAGGGREAFGLNGAESIRADMPLSLPLQFTIDVRPGGGISVTAPAGSRIDGAQVESSSSVNGATASLTAGELIGAFHGAESGDAIAAAAPESAAEWLFG
jgi:V8-like Glu-specific endopeptidase